MVVKMLSPIVWAAKLCVARACICRAVLQESFLYFYRFHILQSLDDAVCMERQLIASLVGLELQDGSLGTQHATLQQVHCCKDLVVGHRSLHQVVVVTTGLTAVDISSLSPVYKPLNVIQNIFQTLRMKLVVVVCYIRISPSLLK